MATFSGWSDFPFVPIGSELTYDKPKWSEGSLSLSKVIREMRRAEGLGVSDEPIDPGLSQLGFVWEQALEYMAGGMSLDDALDMAWKRTAVKLREGVAKQLVVEKDRIRMRPDGFNAAVGEVESYKSTAKSLAKALTQDEFESNFWDWIVYDASYCLALGVDTARWVVLWRAGDYSKGPGGTMPRVLQATMTWSPAELQSNWARVLRVRDQISETGNPCPVVRTPL